MPERIENWPRECKADILQLAGLKGALNNLATRGNGHPKSK